MGEYAWKETDKKYIELRQKYHLPEKKKYILYL